MPLLQGRILAPMKSLGRLATATVEHAANKFPIEAVVAALKCFSSRPLCCVFARSCPPPPPLPTPPSPRPRPRPPPPRLWCCAGVTALFARRLFSAGSSSPRPHFAPPPAASPPPPTCFLKSGAVPPAPRVLSTECENPPFSLLSSLPTRRASRI